MVTRHVDVSHLSDEECSKIISVISRDIALRKMEKERVAVLRSHFDDTRRVVMLRTSSRKRGIPFDDHCLVCGKGLLTFCCFVRRGKSCLSCEHLVCPDCRHALVFNDDEVFYLCMLCELKREVKAKCFDWYYERASNRFKRFGSAKALRAIYKQRLSIEPRVITLLAVCRELQPAQKFSTAVPLKRSESGPRQSVTSSTSRDERQEYSSSEAEAAVYRDRQKYRRKRVSSESEVALLLQRAGNAEESKDVCKPYRLDHDHVTSRTPHAEYTRWLRTPGEELALRQGPEPCLGMFYLSEPNGGTTGILTEVKKKISRSSDKWPPI